MGRGSVPLLEVTSNFPFYSCIWVVRKCSICLAKSPTHCPLLGASSYGRWGGVPLVGQGSQIVRANDRYDHDSVPFSDLFPCWRYF